MDRQLSSVYGKIGAYNSVVRITNFNEFLKLPQTPYIPKVLRPHTANANVINFSVPPFKIEMLTN